MTEETTETTTTETQDDKSYSKEQYDGLKSNLVNQISERDNRLKELETAEAQRVEADKLAESEKLAQNNQHKELLEKSQAEWQAERDELTKSIETMKTEKFNMGLDNTLISNGITDEILILGLKAKYKSTEDAGDFAEWLTAQDLAPKDQGRSSGNAGKVSGKALDSLEQRLASTDPKVKQKALAEQLAKDMGLG